MRHAYLMSCFLSGSRYQKRKQTGKIKKTEELTTKQHETKRQWRENSKRYYKRKKQLKAVLDTTPSSEEDDSLQFIQEANEVQENLQEAAPKEQPFLSQQVHVPVKKKSNLQFWHTLNLF